MTGKHWVIVLIIIIAGIGSYTGLSSMGEGREQKENWSNGDFEILVEKCLTESGDMAVNYPELTTTYCECSNKKIQTQLTKSEYLEITTKSVEDQTKLLLPIFQNCLEEYQQAIENK